MYNFLKILSFIISFIVFISLINLYDRQIMVFFYNSVFFSLFKLCSRTFWRFISCQILNSVSYLQNSVTINTNSKRSRIISTSWQNRDCDSNMNHRMHETVTYQTTCHYKKLRITFHQDKNVVFFLSQLNKIIND